MTVQEMIDMLSTYLPTANVMLEVECGGVTHMFDVVSLCEDKMYRLNREDFTFEELPGEHSPAAVIAGRPGSITNKCMLCFDTGK